MFHSGKLFVGVFGQFQHLRYAGATCKQSFDSEKHFVLSFSQKSVFSFGYCLISLKVLRVLIFEVGQVLAEESRRGFQERGLDCACCVDQNHLGDVDGVGPVRLLG